MSSRIERKYSFLITEILSFVSIKGIIRELVGIQSFVAGLSIETIINFGFSWFLMVRVDISGTLLELRVELKKTNVFKVQQITYKCNMNDKRKKCIIIIVKWYFTFSSRSSHYKSYIYEDTMDVIFIYPIKEPFSISPRFFHLLITVVLSNVYDCAEEDCWNCWRSFNQTTRITKIYNMTHKEFLQINKQPKILSMWDKIFWDHFLLAAIQKVVVTF